MCTTTEIWKFNLLIKVKVIQKLSFKKLFIEHGEEIKSYLWTIFIPEFDTDLDLKMKMNFAKLGLIVFDAKEKT